ncbi:hypothetical protein CsSME_00020007 [Camellia sinensis var. sinensis]
MVTTFFHIFLTKDGNFTLIIAWCYKLLTKEYLMTSILKMIVPFNTSQRTVLDMVIEWFGKIQRSLGMDA